jgi:endoglucanase
MKRSLLLIAALTAVTGLAQAQYMRGVNISGAEWGSNLEYGGGSIPGVYGEDYWYQSPPTFDYFAARGLPFIRLGVLWERLQPAPGGPLVPGNPNDYMWYLKNDIAWAKAAGAQISIVPQNYGRYTMNGTVCIIDNPCNGSSVLVTGADLADFWSKMAAVFKDEPTVVAYDMMGEPHDMGAGNWNTISQKVVNAIRTVDSKKLIMVPGDYYSNATYWAAHNGATSWINDPAGNFYYEAHEYFDFDYSGRYMETYDTELAANPDLADIGLTRLTPFVKWCTDSNVKCYVGEYGIPNAGPSGADFPTIPDARWLVVLDNFLTALDAAGMPGTYWAAGEWWGDYPLSIQPINFTTDREQLQTLLNHLPPDLLRTTSAAASYGYAVAPDSLVAGYGSGLASGVLQATTLPLPTTLGDTRVNVTDSAGTVWPAPLLYVSGRQVNYLVPSGVAAGLANVSVLDNGAAVSSGILQVQPIAPGIFSANSNGQGVAAAYIQRVLPDGTVSAPEPVAAYNTAQGQFVPVPIAFNGDQLVLVLFGTGLDQATASNTTVTVSYAPVTVNYAGAQGQYVGEDQINVQLPSSLAGSGEVPVQVTVGGVPANPVTITFQ